MAAPTTRAPRLRPNKIGYSAAGVASLQERARRLAGPLADDVQVGRAAAMVSASDAMGEHGPAAGTLDKDEHAWELWEEWAALIGLEPFLDPREAAADPGLVSQRLASFMLWVYPQLVGRRASDAKAGTAMGYVSAIIRVLGRRHVPMPTALTVGAQQRGLLRSYQAVNGSLKSAAHRREPMLRSMWQRIESLKEGDALPGRARWSPATRYRDRVILRLGRTLWRCGHRLGEIVQDGDFDMNFITRSCVTYRSKQGLYLVDPSPEQLAILSTKGTTVLMASSGSKTDHFGEKNCPFNSVLPHNGKASCAAQSIIDLELERPVRGAARELEPLFSDEAGNTYTYAVLHRELRMLLVALFGSKVASILSWHSIRIGLACALKMAGCPDDVIQLICRWACPESLKIYARLGIGTNVHWTDLAETMEFDGVQAANIPALDSSEHMAALFDNCTLAKSQRSTLIAAGDKLPKRPAETQLQQALPKRPTVNRMWVVGDRALLSSDLWPEERCEECDGAGWSATIRRIVSAHALLTFDTARSADGGEFSTVRVPLASLRSLP